MIDIRDKNAAIRASVEITDQCIYSKKLMEEEYVLLSFESDTLIKFAKGDYIQTDFGVFRIVTLSRPHQSANGGYTYEQKFHADWERWRNHITFYDRQHGVEKSWKMTQRPEYFLDIICSNIKSADYGDYTFEIDAALTEMKLVEFDSTNIIDALSKIAETWETEWWISDRIIHLSKCEFGTPISLSENEELGVIDREDGSDTNYFTRAYVFGSTRNLPKNYRKNEDGSVVIDGVVEARLKLPAGIPYIDAWENMKDEDVVEGVIILDEVYPRKTGTISTITVKKYTDEIENEDGTKTYEDWNAFRFTDQDLSSLKFSSEYILPGEELRIIFQTGKLTGMEFTVIFNPDGLEEDKSAAQMFEIVRNENYGISLPSDDFKPAVGDTYILYGYDTRFVYTKLVGEAEKELYDKGIEKVAEISRDKSVYNCPTNPVRCAGYKEDSTGNLVHSTIDEIDLDVGQTVTLRSVTHFADYSRVSRVRGFEKKLSNKYEATYIIGESSAYSRGDALEEQVKQLTYQSKQFVNVYGNSVYVVGRYDTTAPSDVNVPSFKRAKYEFLSRVADDIAKGRITFEQGLRSVALAIFKDGAHFGDFVSSLYAGKGAGVDKDGNAEVESLRVRSYMEVMELIVNRLSAIEGDQLLTEADTVERVVDNGDGTYGLYLRSKWDGYFTAQAENNVLKGIINTLASGSGQYYTSWMRVNSVNTALNYIEVTMYPDDEVPSGKNFPPCEMMKLARWGNQTDPKRQSCLYLSSTEGRIVKLTGVTKPIIDKGNYGATFGTVPEFLYDDPTLPIAKGRDYLYARGIVVQDLIQADHFGKPLPNYVDRGQWDATADYYCEAVNPSTGIYETSDVWYMGCKYRCCKTGTHNPPAWNSTEWAMLEGNPDFTVEFAPHVTVCSISNVDVRLDLVAWLHNIDITQDIQDTDVEWSRYSEDHLGNPRPASDNAWALAHAGQGKSCRITLADIDYNGHIPKVIRFMATATLRDGQTPVAAETASIDFTEF